MVAVKQIMLKRDQKSLLDVYREINALRNVDHENIVKLRDVVFSSQDVSLVFEYVESTLKAVILDICRPRNDDLTHHFFVQLLRWDRPLARAAHHASSERIDGYSFNECRLQDIKPENILVSLSGKVKLADFGLACLYVPGDEGRTYSHEIGRVFGVLGTPTEDSWPDWKRLPDGGKMHFEERPPVANWSTLGAIP
ncbi:Cyclin-dependent kinase 20 [Aphelenchoides fujianensis]|nr:Cyclin-dependent kinase 20 [Aphelenchoides fujianensis]